MAATLLRSKFTITKQNLAGALNRLRLWASETSRHYSLFVNFDDPDIRERIELLRTCNNPFDIFQVLGYDLVTSSNGWIVDLVQRDCHNIGSFYEMAMGEMVNFVEPDSFLIFHTDEDELIQWKWFNEEFVVTNNGNFQFSNDHARVATLRGKKQ